MTDQEMMEKMLAFVRSRDDENDVESWCTEAETAQSVLDDFVGFLGWPDYRELTEIEIAERVLTKAHEEWRKALLDLNSLRGAK